jgi:hypothetical protein
MTAPILPKEIWKSVPGFPKYEVSNLGGVRSLPWTYERKEWRHGRIQIVHVGGNRLKGWVKYIRGRPAARMVVLRVDGKIEEVRVHRLVLLAFIGPCPTGMEGCHNDGNPLNNHLDNLRWDTHAANDMDKVAHGTRTNPPVHRGEKHYNARLTDAEVAEIRATPIRRGVTAELARKYNTTHITIRRILKQEVRANVEPK